MSIEDWNNEEKYRYGADPELCPDCHRLRRLCAFHASVQRQGYHKEPAALTLEQLEHLLKVWHAPGGPAERIGKAYRK
jgi:hypothetical protein